MKRITLSRAGRWVLIAGAVLGGLAIGAAIRYGILENEAQAALCRESGAAGWCAVRSALGWSIYYQLFGLAALFLAMAGWLPRWHRVALAGLSLAACGLVVYNATFAALALVVALLAAVKPAASTH